MTMLQPLPWQSRMKVAGGVSRVVCVVVMGVVCCGAGCRVLWCWVSCVMSAHNTRALQLISTATNDLCAGNANPESQESDTLALASGQVVRTGDLTAVDAGGEWTHEHINGVFRVFFVLWCGVMCRVFVVLWCCGVTVAVPSVLPAVEPAGDANSQEDAAATGVATQNAGGGRWCCGVMCRVCSVRRVCVAVVCRVFVVL